jgi:hypothetical protein
MSQALRRVDHRRVALAFALTAGLPDVAMAHGGHAETTALMHPLAHLSFLVAAAFIALPAAIQLARRVLRQRA